MMATVRHVTAWPERDVRNIRPMDFRSTECTSDARSHKRQISNTVFPPMGLTLWRRNYFFFFNFSTLCI